MKILLVNLNVEVEKKKKTLKFRHFWGCFRTSFFLNFDYVSFRFFFHFVCCKCRNDVLSFFIEVMVIFYDPNF
jgi:hypothetical protein